MITDKSLADDESRGGDGLNKAPKDHDGESCTKVLGEMTDPLKNNIVAIVPVWMVLVRPGRAVLRQHDQFFS